MIIGRKKEETLLKQSLNSGKAEFIAVWGRRRVGKTFLIEQVCKQTKSIYFNAIGLRKGTLNDQLEAFTKELSKTFFNQAPITTPKRWADMFELLTEALQQQKPNKKIILFIDELPWLDTRNSKLLQYLDFYWNKHWSKDKRVKLIICGSAASWMVKKIIKDKGGLHNRVTQAIRLNPFSLQETKAYLLSNKIKLNEQQILQIYMSIGGIPFYLSKISKGLSATQNIEQLAFQADSFLQGEFDNLFAALFDDHAPYVNAIKTIAEKRSGIGKTQLLKQLGEKFQGKKGIEILDNLEESGFIQSFTPHFHKKQGIYYRVIDEYAIFYLAWIEPIKSSLQSNALAQGYWQAMTNQAAWHTWAGYAFESVCYKHLAQIRQSLAIEPTAIANSWRHAPRKNSEENGAQIDLLFDRNDGVITLCEIKYSQKPFAIDKATAKNLINKINTFKKITGTKKEIFITMITSQGLKETMYSSELVSNEVCLTDLFN